MSSLVYLAGSTSLGGEAPDLAGGWGAKVGGLVLKQDSTYREPRNVHAEDAITINGGLPRLGSVYVARLADTVVGHARVLGKIWLEAD
jgi:hypothetical protein